MSMHRWLIGAGAIVALAACGSATDATSFQAPPGYTTAVSIGPFAQIWRAPNSHSGIVFMALPTTIEFNKVADNTNIKDATILKHEDVKICGDQDAYYLSMIGQSPESASTSGGGKEGKQQIDLIATHLNSKTYMAMYVRPVGTPRDAAAETAIHGVCQK